MELKKNHASQTVLAVVKASSKQASKYFTKKSLKYKHKFNRNGLPSVIDYFPNKVKKFRPGKRQATALCPFHNERTPSFSINMKTGAYICFACGVSGGGIIDFHMHFYGLKFIDACKDLGVLYE